MEIQNAKAAMDKVQEALDSYERSLGLLHTNSVDEAEINGYFTMAKNDIEQMDPISANCISVRLHQFAFYIQRQFNLEQSRYNWSIAEINRYSADKLENIGGQYCKYETKIYLLCSQDEYIDKLVKIRNYAQLRLDRLTYLSSSIKNLADCFSNYSRTKIAMKNI